MIDVWLLLIRFFEGFLYLEEWVYDYLIIIGI